MEEKQRLNKRRENLTPIKQLKKIRKTEVEQMERRPYTNEVIEKNKKERRKIKVEQKEK